MAVTKKSGKSMKATKKTSSYASPSRSKAKVSEKRKSR